MKFFKKAFKKYRIEIIIFLLSLIFSSWLMFSTFSYSNGEMFIATKAWSDFASHIPLIRSFSFGDNFPPQYPLFSGPTIKYHFLFYFLVGVLEKLGIRIDFALNIPSALGFSLLILMIYVFGKEIFKSKAVGLLSIILFLFFGTLDFINFFAKHPISFNTLSEIFTNKNFISFGPYDGSIISAFWNLNIYTNQRHLGLSYFLSLLIIYVFIKAKSKIKHFLKISIALGILLGLSFLLNMAVFLMTSLVLLFLFIFEKDKRKFIFICLAFAGLISLPQYLFISSSSGFKPIAHFGYLVESHNFINYWFQNLGFNFILIPLGIIIANRFQRKIFLSFFSLFIVGNLIQFTPEIAANHKFFNFFMIIGVMFSSYLLVTIWKRGLFFKLLSILLFLLITLSGIINFFPIYNDKKISLPDYEENPNIKWVITNTPKDSVFLNSQYLYDDASIAGRKIFLGWPYFAWSQGYNTLLRDNLRKRLLSTNDKNLFCSEVNKNNINYAEIKTDPIDPEINLSFFDKNFTKKYENKEKNYIIYDVKKGCI